MEMEDIVNLVKQSPAGMSAGDIEKISRSSRATLNRRLRDAVHAGEIERIGEGRAVMYRSVDRRRAILDYFEISPSERKIATYNEDRLRPEMFDISPIPQLSSFSPLEKRDMVRFLVDFSCASSVLEGGTYSLLDTQALLEYGEKAPGKPLSDAFLVLNHRDAFEYLFEHRELSLPVALEVHRRLTSDHAVPELRDTPHFLPDHQRGVIRKYEDVHIAQSTYSPPFRPGTYYLQDMLQRILDEAGTIENPVQSAFHILTRLPYLQPFIDGNKRVSRVLCNVPLLNAGLPPISFADFSKRDYIVSLLAFYELGDTSVASKCFSDAYLKSCRRLGLDRTGTAVSETSLPGLGRPTVSSRAEPACMPNLPVQFPANISRPRLKG